MKTIIIASMSTVFAAVLFVWTKHILHQDPIVMNYWREKKNLKSLHADVKGTAMMIHSNDTTVSISAGDPVMLSKASMNTTNNQRTSQSARAPLAGKYVDHRIKIKRPYMETASHTFIESMRDIERKYKPSPECDAFGGTKFIDGLLASSKSIFHENNHSNIVSFHNDAMDVYFAQNVSVVMTLPPDYDGEHMKTRLPEFALEADGTFVDDDARSRMLQYTSDTKLNEMTMSMKHRDGLDRDCAEYIEYPVMLVDNQVDTLNWWFFLKSILHHYIAVAVVQPKIMGEYRQDSLRVMFALEDSSYSRSFVDAFEFFFSDGRGRDSSQIWHVMEGTDSNHAISTVNHTRRRFCFRKLLWAPGSSTGADKILINKFHKHTNCFSSIVYSYAAQIKAALHIPSLPRPDKPRVVWVGRNPSPSVDLTAWQMKRFVDNQDEIIGYLRDECSKIGVDFIVADFYGDKANIPFQEQALLVSRANVMIGMHGAGLNMFHFMPFNSVVVEIHRNSNMQMNSANFVNHIREGKYISTDAEMGGPNGHSLKKEPVWDTLKGAIEEWCHLA